MTLSRYIRTDRLVSRIFFDSRSRYLFRRSFCQVWKACTTRLSMLTLSFISWLILRMARDF